MQPSTPGADGHLTTRVQLGSMRPLVRADTRQPLSRRRLKKLACTQGGRSTFACRLCPNPAPASRLSRPDLAAQLPHPAGDLTHALAIERNIAFGSRRQSNPPTPPGRRATRIALHQLLPSTASPADLPNRNYSYDSRHSDPLAACLRHHPRSSEPLPRLRPVRRAFQPPTVASAARSNHRKRSELDTDGNVISHTSQIYRVLPSNPDKSFFQHALVAGDDFAGAWPEQSLPNRRTVLSKL